MTERFSVAFKGSPVVVSNQDCDLRYTWVYNTFLGHPPEAVIGKRDSDLLERPEDLRKIEALKWEVIKSGVGQRQEVSCHSGGIERHYDLTIEPLRIAEGVISGITCVMVELTHEKRMEFEKEELTRIWFESASVGITYLNSEAKFLRVNAKFCEMTGYSADELLQMTVSDLTHPEDEANCDHKIFHAYFRGELPAYECEKRYIRKDGSICWVAISAQIIHDAVGRPLYSFGIVQNITERKQAEAALQRREQVFRYLSEGIPDIVVRFDRQRRCVYINPAIEGITGLPRDLFLGKRNQDLERPFEPCSSLSHALDEVFCSGQPRDLECYFPAPGERRYFLVKAVPETAEDGTVETVLTVARDITERKRMEDEQDITLELLNLVNSSGNSQKLIQGLTTFLQNRSGCDAVGIRLREGWDFPFCQTKGFSSEFLRTEKSVCALDQNGCFLRDSKGKILLECLCGSVLKNEWDFLQPATTAHGSFWCNDLFGFTMGLSEANRKRLRGKCLQSGYQSIALVPLGTKNKRLGLLQLNFKEKDRFTPGVISLLERLADKLSIALEKFQAEQVLEQAHDLLEQRVRERTSELQAANMALADSEERFRQMSENVHEVFWLSDASLIKMLYVSPAYEEIWGRPCKELYENPRAWINAVHPEDRNQVRMAYLWNRNSNGSMQREYRIVRPDGSIRWIWDHGSSVRDKSGRIYRIAGIARDITQRKRAEEALKESEASMRTLGNNLPNGAIYQFVRSAGGSRWFNYLSEGIEQLHGIPVSQVLAEPTILESTIHLEDAPRLRKAEDESARMLTVVDFEGRIRTPAGEIKWLHWRSAPRRLENGDTLWDGVITDITKRKMAENALNRAHRALLVLKECGEALARAGSESALLNRICEIIVQIGGAKMAWVGLAEQDEEKTVRPVACAGDDEDYLGSVKITWADNMWGCSPSGMAIRTRKESICRDISMERRFDPWRDAVVKRGYASSIALPLFLENRCCGNLSIYSGEIDAFSEQEVGLLKQLAGDLSYGIFALRTREQCEQLQGELLRISEREKQLIAQELHDGLCQHLAGTALMGSLLHRRLVASSHEEAEQAGNICNLLNIAVNEARNLSHGLHPVGSGPGGLDTALAQLAKTVSNLFHIDCSFVPCEAVTIDSEAAANHLFRITQEAVNNAIKHGQANRVSISLSYVRNRITLSIRDNGHGFPEKLPASRGMGLQIMTHRATTIGASLEVRRAGRRGTVVNCILPLSL